MVTAAQGVDDAHLASLKVCRRQHSADEARRQLAQNQFIGSACGRRVPMALMEARRQKVCLVAALTVDALRAAHRVLGRLWPLWLQEADVPRPELCAGAEHFIK